MKDKISKSFATSKQSTNESSNQIKEGNKFYYLLFTLFNFMLFLSSIGILGCAIHLIVLCKGANVISIFFILIALALFMLTCCGFRLRKSIYLLACYLIIIATILGWMLLTTLILMINKHMVKHWASKAYDVALASNEIQIFSKTIVNSNVSELEDYKE